MKKLIKKILENGGATLNAKLENADLNSGYMVSEVGAERVFRLEDVEGIEKTLKEYAKRISSNEYVGAWVDDNKLYIDISKHYKSKKQALKVGAENKQLAIYDIASAESIYLTKSVFILYAVDKALDDIRNIAEYNNLQEIEAEFNIKNGRQYVIHNVDELVNAKLLKDRFTIIKEEIALIEE